MLTFIARILNQFTQGYLKRTALDTSVKHAVTYNVPFRCWPIDMDAFMHMNNASYVRVAELARWRIFPQTGFFDKRNSGILFLVVDQSVQYFKPIGPLQQYTVKVTITSSENKWLHYKHAFIQHPVREGKEPIVYALVESRAVLKRKNGKTVKMDEATLDNEFYKQLHG